MRFSPADLSSWGTRRPPPDNSRSFSGTAQPPYAGPSPLWVQTQRMWLLWCWLWLFQIKPSQLYSFHHRLNQVKDAKWLQHYLRWFLRHIQDGGMSCSPKTKRVRNVTKSVSKKKSNQLTIISDVLHNTLAACEDRVMEEGAAQTVLDQEIRPVCVHLNQLRETVHQSTNLWYRLKGLFYEYLFNVVRLHGIKEQIYWFWKIWGKI